MPPSRSCKSGDENSGGRSSGKYIDMDICSDTVYLSKAEESKRSHTRSDGQCAQAPGRSDATELHINLQIEVGDRRFYLHKFPLLPKSGRLNSLVFESRHTEKDRIVLSDIPGGAPAFEFIARQFYGGKVILSPHNVAAIRCAADYLEITGEGHSSLVSMTEDYLNHEVTESWRDSITVLKSCAELQPWAEDLEIVRRCSEAIAWKCSETRKGRDGDWWYHDVGALSIHAFSRVIHALTAQGYSSLVPSAVSYYAERWLQLTKGSDISTTLKLSTPASIQSDSPQAASFMAFTGFNQDIVAKDARQAQHKNRVILQGIVNLLPTDTGATASLSVKFLVKLLRVACFVNAGSFCKTDLAKRIASQLEKVALEDLLIPAAGEATYDVDVVLQIFEWYVQEQSWGKSPPQSPRGRVSTGGSDTSSRSLTSSVSSSDLSDSGGSVGSSGSSVSSVRTGSRRLRSISSISGSDSESSSSGGSFRSSSDTGSSISGSSSNLSTSFRSTTSESSTTSIGAFSESSSSSSASGVSSDESSVKLEKKKKAFYATESCSPSRKTLLAPTAANFKVAQLLEAYLEEVAKDSSIDVAQFMKLAELFTEFPRDSDDSIYRALDGFLRAHPSLTDAERTSLCRLMDPGALSLAACVHAASNERLPLRVIVQLLFSEQIKLRNEMTGNDVIHEKDLGSALPSFSTSTSSSSTTDSSSDATSTTLSSGSSSTSASSSSSSNTRKSSRRSSRSISSASALENELAIDIRRSPSVVSSPLLGGLSVKNTIRFVLAEVESLRKSVQEMESVKSRLRDMETLKMEMEHLTSKFQEMSQDYVGMTHQVEELTKVSKHAKSGWSSGWKKVTKSFQSKDNNDSKFETPPLPPVKLLPTDFPDLPILRTQSETLHPKTSRADSASAHTKTTARADSLPVTKPKTDSATLRPKAPRADSLPQLPKVAPPDLTKRGEAVKPGTAVQTPRDSFKTSVQEIGVKGEATTPLISKRGEGAKPGTPLQTPRDSVKVAGQETVVKSETITPPKSGSVKTRDDYVIRAHRSHHVEDVHRRSVCSRSTSPDYVRSRHYKDSDSVTSTSTYSRASRGRGGHQYRHSGRNGGSMEKHRSHEAERGLVHEHHGVAHRKHRHNEGSHNGQSQPSGDVHPARHSSATHQSHHSGRHRYAREGSVASHHTGSEQHSGSLRNEQRRKDRHKEHHGHRRHQSFSDDSTASSDFETHRRRQHRT